MVADSMDQLVALCKRRGFIFSSSEAYGGLRGCYDYGPMGVELKKNLITSWWESMVYEHENIFGLDSSILTHEKTLHYSGHSETFHDMMVDCRNCKIRLRHDHLPKDNNCPECGACDWTEPRAFNLMMQTHLGPMQSSESLAYLRPETAQGIFLNFKNTVDANSPKLPFGICQVGKAFRNEITPKNFIFRVREFEQMELEYFVTPGEDEQWHQYWIEKRFQWWIEQGLDEENLHQSPQTGDDLAHYAKATTDILYEFPHGLEELEGIANRSDYDLGSHSKNQDTLNLDAEVKDNAHSTVKMSIKHDDKHITPYVIEPSCGVDRGVLALLNEAYHIDNENGDRVVLKLKPHLAPVKIAVIPLAKNKSRLVEKAQDIQKLLKKAFKFWVKLENTGNIGKNYRRHDEIGTPVCVTIDFDTLPETTNDPALIDTVTLRDRDTLKQTRVKIQDLIKTLEHTYGF